MRLAKQHIDIGLFTNDIDSQRQFWSDSAGLRFDHELQLFDDVTQYRYDAHDSVIKVNHYTGVFNEQPPSGYSGVSIARAGQPAWSGRHPGGQSVRLVPPGTDGIVGIGITVSTPDPARMMAFYIDAMEFEAVAKNVARCGDTLLFVERGAGGSDSESFIGPDFRYLTVQIYDADQACADIVARGGRLGAAAVNYGKVARYGFVLDPDGNWIEMSARTSLTGIEPTDES